MEDMKFPKTVPIDTVGFCNLKCSMCAHKNMKRKKGRMEWSLFTKIIAEIADESPNSRVYLVFFGEALILKKTKPSIYEMIKYSKEAGLKDVVLNSNGNLLDRASSEKLIDAGLDEIYIGIDAFTEQTYNQLRVGGNFNQTVRNVLDLIDVKKEKKAKTLKIYVQFIEMAVNIHEKEDFVRFWLSKGVDVKIRKELTWSGLLENKKDENIGERHICNWIMSTMAITDQGNVVTCPGDPEARFIAGNVRTQSLKEIWNGNLRDLRSMHADKQWDRLPFPCNECKDWSISGDDRIISCEKPGLKRTFTGMLKKLYQGSSQGKI